MVTGKPFIYSLVTLLFIMSLVVVSVPLGGRVEAAGVTYYVNAATGSDANTPAQAQNPATPWLTITHAGGAVAAGDTIMVAPGTYDTALGESFPIYIGMSLTLQSSGGAAVTTISSDGSGGVRMDLNDGQQVTFTGFTVTGGGIGIYIYDDDGDSDLENNITITNNIVRDNSGNGIEFSDQITGSSVINVSGNQLLENDGFDNLYFQGSVAGNALVSVTNNTIEDSWGDAIEFCSPFGGNSHTTVSGNTITYTDEAGIYICEGIWDGATVTITGNNISHTYDDGIYVNEVVDDGQITISGNTITESEWNGIDFGGEDTIANNARVSISGNTIHDIWDYGIYFESNIYNNSVITITNNNISDTGYDGIEFCEDFHENSRATITGNTISGCRDCGLDFEEEIRGESIITITGNTFTGNCEEGLYIEQPMDNSQVTVDGNNISNNGSCTKFGLSEPARVEKSGSNDAELATRPAPTNKDDDEEREAAENADTNDISIHDGIYIYFVDGAATVVVSRNTISSNGHDGVYIEYMDNANQVTVSPCNLITGNPNYGLLNDSGKMINGEINWWGAADGPSGEGPGDGDKVSSDVDFEPWAIADDCSTRPSLPPNPDVSPSNPNNWTRNLNPPTMSVQFVSVNPQQAVANQPVTISTNVVNTGDQGGNLNVTLKINGQVEESRMVSVGPQASQPIKFTVAKSQPGTYAIDIGGQQGSFAINGAGSTTDKPVNGVVIAIIVVCALVLTTFVVLIAFRRPT